MRRLITLSVFLPLCAFAAWQNGYQYRRTVTISAGQVPSALNNFTVLLPLSLGAAKVQHTVTVNSIACPADLIVTSDAAGLSPLSWECEPWDISTGTGSIWVRVPTAFNGAAVYVFYGNASVVTWQGDAPGTWESHYKLILHFSGGSSVDSTGLNSPTNSGAPPVAGQIGSAASFDGSIGHITVPSTASLRVWTGDFTVSVWFYMNALTYYETLFDTVGREFYLSINTSTSGYAAFGGAQGAWGGGTGWTPGAWHYFVATRSGGGNVKVYLDGELQPAVSPYGGSSNDSGSDLVIGTNPSTGGTGWDGKQDEFRLSNIARPADWVTAEYNNQFNPSGFLTIGAESTQVSATRGTLLIGELN